ncbi:MAG TPA: pentapeptide repeat-containing protein, partial [Thermomicrobiales bacterium]|nr:pentapeptide repeat-containing protein [Thermomicrobiales bacterium]
MGAHRGSEHERNAHADAAPPAPEATPPKLGAPPAARVAGVALLVVAIGATIGAAALALTQTIAPERLPLRLTDATLPIVLALAAALLWAATLLWIVPRWQAAAWQAGRVVDPKVAFDVENSARATLGQVLGGIAVLAGLVVAWQQLGQTAQNLRVSEEGQITDRFTRAVDQLGDDDLTVRLGGIYALERIARDSPRDYAATMEVLTAFARQPPASASATPSADPGETTSEDVAAVMRVIGRRAAAQIAQEEAAGLDCLHLERARLPGIDVSGYNLAHVCLNGAILSGALLQDANLAGDDLTGADMSDGNLEGADLRRAMLSGVRFAGANLSRADLAGANLLQANLAAALLESADLRGATLLSADLRGAFLLRTKLDHADLLDADLTNAT